MKHTLNTLIVILCSVPFLWGISCTEKGWTKIGPDLTFGNEFVIAIQENNAGVVHRLLQSNTVANTRIQKFVGGYWIDIPHSFTNQPTKIAFNSFDELYVAVNRELHKFNGSSWQLIGTTTGSIQELVVDPVDDVFIGGFFMQVNGNTANHIAKWNGSTWSSLGFGVTSSFTGNRGVWSIAFDPSGNLYASGRFDNASGTVVTNVAKWDGSNWTSVGSGITTDYVPDIEIYNSDIYATSYVSGTTHQIESFDGTNWITIYSGSTGQIDLELSSSGDLYASGIFPSLGVNCRIASYDGTSFSSFANSDGTIYDLYINNVDDIYVGVEFMSYIDNLQTVGFAKYGLIPDNIALDFDGVDDFIQVTGFLSQFSFTTSAWFKASLTSNGGAEDRIFSYGGTRFEVGLTNSGHLWVFDQDRGITSVYGSSLRDDTWHHVAITKNGPARAIYLDGVQLEVWYPPTTVLQYGPIFRIGNWTGSSAAGAFFEGQIADVRVYDVGLSPTEIQNSMHCQLSGNETNLRAWWPLEDGIPTANNTAISQIQDLSPNSNDGSLSGFSLIGNHSNFVCADEHFIFTTCCGDSDLIAPIQEFCPPDIVLNTDPGACHALHSYSLPTFEDNCDGTGLNGNLVFGWQPGTFMPLGVSTIIYEYTDIAGNGPAQCSFNITVVDNEDPVLTCPNGVVTVTNTMTIHPLSFVNFSDNCQVNTSSVQFVSAPTPYPYDCSDMNTTVNLFVSGQDMAGNQSTCFLNLSFDDCYGKCCPSTLVARPKPDPFCPFTATNKIISDQTQLYGNLHYQAGVSICLLPGFDATGATTFVAEITPCN